MFRSTDIEAMLGVKRQTLSNWCAEFEGYLSPAARPEPGGWRRFNHDDIAVINLIRILRDENKTTEQIHAALKMGHRLPLDTDSALAPAGEHAITLQRQMRMLQDMLADRDDKLEALRAELYRLEGERRLLQSQAAEREQLIRALYREIAKLEA